MTEVLLSPEKLCRICLRAEDEFQSIFEENIYRKIEEVSVCKVKSGDHFPLNICSSCKTNLDSAYSFKQLCENSYRRLCDHFKIMCFPDDTVKSTQTDFPSILPCDKCSEKFTTSGELISHLRRIHLRSSHECYICGIKFPRLQTLQAHLAIKHPESGITQVDTRCSECSKIFSRKEHLRRHMLRVHKKIDISLEPRQRISQTKEEHFAIENPVFGENYYPRNFPTEVREEESFGVGVVKNEEIGEDNFAETDYPSYMEENSSENPDNSVPYSMGIKLENHSYESCTQESDFHQFEEEEEEDDTNYSNCSNGDDVIVQDIKEEPPEDMYAEEEFPYHDFEVDEEANGGTSNKKYKCLECEKSFTRPERLRNHYKMLHPFAERPSPIEERKFKCPDCDKGFFRHDHLKRHLSIHTGERPFTCEHCGLQFRRKDEYKIHLGKHEQRRPFECTKCNKGFLRKDTLKEHLQRGCQRRKASEKMFDCSLCEKKFVSQRSLQNHIKRHSERGHECFFCKATFLFKSHLGEHIRTKHSGEVWT